MTATITEPEAPPTSLPLDGRPCRRCGGPRAQFKHCRACKRVYMAQFHAKRRMKFIRGLIKNLADAKLPAAELDAMIEAARRRFGANRLAELVHEEIQDAFKSAKKRGYWRRALRALAAMQTLMLVSHELGYDRRRRSAG
jgi:hypothetical protein